MLVEHDFFFIPNCIRRPQLERSLLEYCHAVWYTQWCNEFEDSYNRFDRIPACDRRTDGRTDIMRRPSLRYL